MNFTDRDFLDSAVRTHFPTFLHRCALTLNPGTPFLPNWHHEAIGDALEQVRHGQVRRLIINAPPRSFKSIETSVAFPAYVLGHDPSQKIFGISYGADLAIKHARDFLSIMQSEWYQRAFPNTRISRVADHDAYTSGRGYRKATSIYATITGLGGEWFIVDDPIKPIDAQSDTLRNHVNDWFSSTLRSRLDNQLTGKIVIVMQRVHQNDLTGHLLEKGGWTLRSFPAIAPADEEIPIGDGRIHRRRAGEALHPTREPLAVLEELRRELGSDVFESQYQQSPVPFGGAMIKRDWLRYYDRLPTLPYGTRTWQSLDTAAKDGAQNDWSVCTTWKIVNKSFYLIDVTRGRFDYPTLKRLAIELARAHRPQYVLIEDASTGIALAQELKTATFGGIVKAVPVERDKVSRVYVNQAKFEAGLVLLPRGASFLPIVETELLTFPQGKTDDIVDSMMQALWYNTGYDFTYRAFDPYYRDP